MNSESPGVEKAASEHQGLKIGLLLCLFIVGLDASIVNVLLPRIQSDFGVTVQETAAVGTVYLTMLAALGLPFGRLSDLFSANRIFIGGVVCFGLGSLWCALSPTLWLLLGGRAVQGVGGAMLASSMGAVVFGNVGQESRGKVLGGAMAVMSFGSLIGPPVGGYFAHHSSWSWAFLVNVPICAFCLLALSPYWREVGGEKETLSASRFDLVGCGLSAVGLVSFPLALQTMGEKGTGDTSFLLFSLLAVSSVILFVVVEKRAAYPLLPGTFFSLGPATRLGFMKVALYTAFSGVMLVYPFFISSREGFARSDVGWLLLSSALALVFLTPIAGACADKLGARTANLVGGVALVLGSLGAMGLDDEPSKLAVAFSLAALGGACAFLMTGSTVAFLNEAGPSETGIFSAVNSLCSPVGGALGFALFSAVYGEPSTQIEHYQGFQDSLRFVAGLAVTVTILALTCPSKRRFPKNIPSPNQEEP